MKNLNFKRKETAQLRYLEEIKGGNKSRMNWDKVVYLAILGLIIFFILRYIFLHMFYISADGQVLFENVEISHTENIRLERFYFEEGEDIEVGDTLFTYMSEEDLWGQDELDASDETDGGSWTDREEYMLRKNIDLNNTQIRGDKALILSYKQQLSQLENEVILGTASERDLNNLEYQISKLETAIKLAQSENAVLSQQLLELENRAKEQIDQNSELSQGSRFKAFLSPIDGYVARIFKEPYEVALKSQIIMKIHQADSVHIKGYFDQEYLKHVNEGDLVQISFPDGRESEGVIERFYASTAVVPEEFQKKFEPTKRTVVADIVPAEGIDTSVWKRHYKLSVKLIKRTF